MRKLTFETLGKSIYVYLKINNAKFVYCKYAMYDCWIEVNKDNEAIYDTIGL